MISEAQRGLIIVGPNDDLTLTEPLMRLAEYLGYPILADPLSQLRCDVSQQGLVLTSYDAFLRIDSFIEMRNQNSSFVLALCRHPSRYCST